ncbi:MAG: hypothetical protein KC776_12855 [Myxococcales bacterium]|nr:hypothetical protein [Myxococcales bacterium]MCB9578399.1 hypothetical protein [Polyangiaceae bacterium]
MRRFPAVLVLLILALTSCKRTESAPAKTWYDAAPLVESLRPEERADATKSTDLTLYDLDLGLDHDLKKFSLTEDVYFTNTVAPSLSEIVLRVYANATGKQLVALASGKCLDGDECTVSAPAPSVIQVALKKPLERGKRIKIRLALTGTLSSIEPSRTTLLAQGLESMERMGSGKGAGDYGLLAESGGVASFANFYAVLARRSGSSWERGEKSTMGDLGAAGISHVRLKVTAAPDVTIVSSGITTETKPVSATGDAGPEREVHVVAARVRDFALLASRRFESATRKVGGVSVRSHYLAGDEHGGKKVLDAAAASLAVYEKRFGRYPYADLDVVEAPLVGGAGGVEFSGLVTVANMLYRPALSEGPLGMLTKLLGGGMPQMGDITDDMLEFVTAHEVAHQYWPGLVGSDTRRHPYVDESMAQYSAVLYFEDRYGKERAKLEADRQVAANYQMMRLLGGKDAAVDRPVHDFESELAYAGLVYGKGPFFFSELRKTVGDEKFFRVLSAYVKKHRFQEAPTRALVDEMATGKDAQPVAALARRWLDESHGDEDLGGPDVKKLLAGILGPEAAERMGPEMEAAMKLMLRFLSPQKGDDSGAGILDQLLSPKGAP